MLDRIIKEASETERVGDSAYKVFVIYFVIFSCEAIVDIVMLVVFKYDEGNKTRSTQKQLISTDYAGHSWELKGRIHYIER